MGHAGLVLLSPRTHRWRSVDVVDCCGSLQLRQQLEPSLQLPFRPLLLPRPLPTLVLRLLPPRALVVLVAPLKQPSPPAAAAAGLVG